MMEGLKMVARVGVLALKLASSLLARLLWQVEVLLEAVVRVRIGLLVQQWLLLHRGCLPCLLVLLLVAVSVQLVMELLFRPLSQVWIDHLEELRRLDPVLLLEEYCELRAAERSAMRFIKCLSCVALTSAISSFISTSPVDGKTVPFADSAMVLLCKEGDDVVEVVNFDIRYRSNVHLRRAGTRCARTHFLALFNRL
jgi:hypothetical protein